MSLVTAALWGRPIQEKTQKIVTFLGFFVFSELMKKGYTTGLQEFCCLGVRPVNLVRYWEWLLEILETFPGTEDKKVLNFTAQSFYLRKRIEGGPQLEIYGKTVNGLIEVEVEWDASGYPAVVTDSVQDICRNVETERMKRNKVLRGLEKFQPA